VCDIRANKVGRVIGSSLRQVIIQFPSRNRSVLTRRNVLSFGCCILKGALNWFSQEIRLLNHAVLPLMLLIIEQNRNAEGAVVMRNIRKECDGVCLKLKRIVKTSVIHLVLSCWYLFSALAPAH